MTKIYASLGSDAKFGVDGKRFELELLTFTETETEFRIDGLVAPPAFGSIHWVIKKRQGDQGNLVGRT